MYARPRYPEDDNPPADEAITEDYLPMFEVDDETKAWLLKSWRHRVCINCKRPFVDRRHRTSKRYFCSIVCKNTDNNNKPPLATHAEAKQAIIAANRLAGVAPLTPQLARNIRSAIAHYVTDHIIEANEVVMGRKTWTAVQARVFANLLNKVVPDLSASFVQHEHTNKTIVEMSREELERIAAGIEPIIEGEVINEDQK